MVRSTLTALLSTTTICLLLAACKGAPKPEAQAATVATAEADAGPKTKTTPAWPQSDKAVTPLLLGNPLPDVELRTLEDAPITLKEAVGGKAAVLVFYRGGWCPFCMTQLSGLRLIQKDLEALDYQLIAISPDQPIFLKRTLGRESIGYRLLSDRNATAMRAFGIGYEADAELLKTLAGYNIDLEQYSGEKHHVLPVPSVYLVDEAGILQFSYVHPDYRVRVPQEVILAAAKAIKAQRHFVKTK
jgi:peroxiredoxin